MRILAICGSPRRGNTYSVFNTIKEKFPETDFEILMLKNLFDRFGFYAHKPCYFEKYAMSVVTCSGYGADHALKYMDKGLSIFGFNLVPPLELHYEPGSVPEEQRQENEEKCIAAFRGLLKRIREDAKDKPALNILILFGIFKEISLVARDVMPADYEYYKDKKDYYYDAPIPSYMKWIAGKVVKKELSKIF